MAIKQSFAWWSFESIPAQDLIRGAADIGYQAIEMPPQEHWQSIKDHGLIPLNTQAHALIPEGLNRKEHYARIEKEVKEKLELAAAYKMPYLICFSGDRMGLSDDEALENCVINLKKLTPLAEDAGVTLHFEMLNSKVDHIDFQADSTAWAVELCKRVDSANFKLLYDVYHMQIMEGDLIRTIQTFHEYIGHYHTAGNPGRNDLNDAQEIHYPAVFKAIKDSAYDGFIGHEFTPKDDALKALKAAYDLTEKSLA